MSDDDSMLAVPVSANDHTQGHADATVTLVEYGDYQCPACGMAYPVVQQIRRHYAGELRFVFRNFPLAQAHPFARMAADVAEASATLGRFWEMHDWLFENQDTWVSMGAAGLAGGVRELGIDENAIEEALRAPEIAERISRDFSGGVRSGVNGTPSFFVNGRLHQGDFASLAQAIGSAIARRR